MICKWTKLNLNQDKNRPESYESLFTFLIWHVQNLIHCFWNIQFMFLRHCLQEQQKTAKKKKGISNVASFCFASNIKHVLYY